MAKKKATKKKATKKTAKKTTKKSATKKKAGGAKKTAKKTAKATRKKGAKRKPNPAFMRPLTPSSVLAAIVGEGALPRTEAVKKLWNYIKRNDLQDRINRRMINADAKLRELFGKSKVTMFEIAKILKKHLS